MGNYILVPLKANDRVEEEIIPRIEQVAQPGATVIFLIPYRANRSIRSPRMSTELDKPTDKKALIRYSYEKQTQLADQSISLARETFHRRGVKVIGYVYMGHLRRLLKAYRRNGNVHRVVLPQANASSIVALLHGGYALFLSLKRLNFLRHFYNRHYDYPPA